MKRLRILLKYFAHFFSAKHTGGHGVHSPFLYDFTVSVIREKKSQFYAFKHIEELRSCLKSDQSLINIQDYGTGNNRTESVANIVRKSVSSLSEGQLLFRMVNYLKPRNVLELGTSLGVSTAYLASGNSNCRCVSIEGSDEIAWKARANLTKLGIANAEVMVGNIDVDLDNVLNDLSVVDFVYIDANHTSEAVLTYFGKIMNHVTVDSVIVLDDIHWSADMEHAWKIIKTNEAVTSTIDLFYFGIVFLNNNFQRRHFKMRTF